MAERQDSKSSDHKKVLESISRSYGGIAGKILEYCIAGEGKGRSYRRLADYYDRFGSRFSGTNALEDAIDFMLGDLKKEGLDNVHGEDAMISRWVRNDATAELLTPRNYKFAITALGSSIGTPEDGITADAIVLKSFEEMKEKAEEVKGKIVIFNQEWKGYNDTATYRNNGAAKAAPYGAIATLIRSLTPFSLYTLHTGWQDYQDGVQQIPSACITTEDADTFARMQARGEKLRVKITMNCKNYPDVPSRNTVAEIKGTTFPDEVVLISGHMDCWDLGVGAMDDGGGAFISREALSVIRDLHLYLLQNAQSGCVCLREKKAISAVRPRFSRSTNRKLRNSPS